MKKPNILFILADDQGAWALGSAGNPEIQTPNLDALAARGARFTDFFCASPVCSPARASILTGVMPSRHGVHDWLRGGNVDVQGSPELRNLPEYASEHEAIRYTEHLTAYTDLLAQNGYTCALSGKWHLGDSLSPQHGFSRWFTIGRGGCSYMRPDIVKDGRLRFEEDYATDLITEDALQNIDALAGADQPFYLSVHYTAPHSPWDAANHPASYIRLYGDCPFHSTPNLPAHPWQTPTAPDGSTPEGRRENLTGYYAAVTAMDAGIGRILKRLDEKGELDNTLVIFTSDNGMNMGHHGIWGKGNGTFPLNMFDTSVKVPFLLAWPGRVSPMVSDEMLSHYDIFPTLMELLEIPCETRQALTGRSFARHLMTGQPAGGDFVVVYDEYGPTRMIRTREWKYVHRYPYGPCELYHLTNDPGEENNLFGAQGTRARTEQLRARMEQWFHAQTDPALDGAREGVTGFGQLRRVGIYAEGKQAHHQN